MWYVRVCVYIIRVMQVHSYLCISWLFVFGLATYPAGKEYGEGRSTELGVLKFQVPGCPSN
jgi:hypothetical protein